jgi:nitrous oxidase accessory protein NosD
LRNTNENTIENNITNSQVIKVASTLLTLLETNLFPTLLDNFIGVHLFKGSTGNTLKNNNLSNNGTTSENMGISVRDNSDGNILERITS